MNCPECGSPRGIIGYLCGGNHDPVYIPKDIYEIDPNHKHKFGKPYQAYGHGKNAYKLGWVQDCITPGCIKSKKAKVKNDPTP